MRQPKFRGFSLETNSWHYGHGWFEVDYTEEYKQEKGIEDKAILYTDGSPIECELDSMGTFTGLKDKNGVEIYEGDLFWWSDALRVVVFREDKASFMGKRVKGYANNNRYFYLWNLQNLLHLVDVTGNIHENLELITV